MARYVYSFKSSADCQHQWRRCGSSLANVASSISQGMCCLNWTACSFSPRTWLQPWSFPPSTTPCWAANAPAWRPRCPPARRPSTLEFRTSWKRGLAKIRAFFSPSCYVFSQGALNIVGLDVRVKFTRLTFPRRKTLSLCTEEVEKWVWSFSSNQELRCSSRHSEMIHLYLHSEFLLKVEELPYLGLF